MSENQQQFRNVAFGGFHKQDVLNYIESANTAHAAKSEALEKELAAVKAALAALEVEKTALTTQRDDLSARLEETAAKLTKATADLEDKGTRLAALAEENATLKAETAKLKPAAEAYENVKGRVAGIELEAHCRAQAAEAAAREQINNIVDELEAWILKVQSGYDRLRTDVDATISHAGGELGRVGKSLESISCEFSEHDTALEAIMSTYREMLGPQAPTPLDVN